MTFSPTYAEVFPFISVRVPAGKVASATAWVTSIAASMNERYGDRITDARKPIFLGFAGDAITRRLERPSKEVVVSTVGPANVRFTDRGPLSGWFMPEEVAEMDRVCGVGGVSFVRMSAPDPIRFGNLVESYPYNEDESLEGDLPLDGS